jgi:hypothetical protein
LTPLRDLWNKLVGRSPDPASPSVGAIASWFRVTWDESTVRLEASPPDRQPWTQEFTWSSVIRVCFKCEGMLVSDGIYVYTSERSASYVVPTEASGGAEFWSEILRRGLFDAELAIRAASSAEGVFCWPKS